MGQTNYAQAMSFLEESFVLFRALGEDYGAAFALNRLGTIDLHTGNLKTAETRFEEGLALAREVGDQDAIAALLGQLGYAALLRGEFGRATVSFEESLGRYREIGSRLSSGTMLDNLGRTVLEQGDHERAARLLEEGLALNREVGNLWYVAKCLEAVAVAISRRGAARSAARLWGAAEALREAIGTPVPPGEHVHYERWLLEVRSGLEEPTFAAARTEGGAMAWERAVAEAVSGDQPVSSLPSNEAEEGTRREPLTPSEREILRLIAAGHSNRAISEALFISVPTVKVHVTNIHTKLWVESRGAAAAHAHRSGLA